MESTPVPMTTMMNRFLTEPRRLCGFVLLAGVLYSTAVAQAPVNRRFSVRRVADGFVVYGFRAEVGRKNRFELRLGQEAAAVRTELGSVQWDSAVDHLSDARPTASVRRQTYSKVAESLDVALGEPDGKVWLIEYRVKPALFSRTSLLRFLRAAFGDGQVMEMGEDRVRISFFSPNPDRALLVEGTRMTDEVASWSLRYMMSDQSLRPKSTPPKPAGPVDAVRAKQIWPPAGGHTPPDGSGGYGIPRAGEPESGLRQVYPPPATSQPHDEDPGERLNP